MASPFEFSSLLRLAALPPFIIFCGVRYDNTMSCFEIQQLDLKAVVICCCPHLIELERQLIMSTATSAHGRWLLVCWLMNLYWTLWWCPTAAVWCSVVASSSQAVTVHEFKLCTAHWWLTGGSLHHRIMDKWIIFRNHHIVTSSRGVILQYSTAQAVTTNDVDE